MLLFEIKQRLSAELLTGETNLDLRINFGCASDLMSDVLAFSHPDAVLLTGLVNIHTIQTSFIAEIKAIVFVRGKKPPQDLIEEAKKKRIPLLSTPFSMYEAAGILYAGGLIPSMGCFPHNEAHE